MIIVIFNVCNKYYIFCLFIFVILLLNVKKMNAKFNEIINQRQLVLVDFYADWCGPCKMMSPILQETKAVVKDEVKIIKINVDQHQDLASEFMVRGVPTLMLFKEGKMLWRQSGVLNKSQLIEIINQHKN